VERCRLYVSRRIQESGGSGIKRKMMVYGHTLPSVICSMMRTVVHLAMARTEICRHAAAQRRRRVLRYMRAAVQRGARARGEAAGVASRYAAER